MPVVVELPVDASHVPDLWVRPSSSLLFKRGAQASALLDLGDPQIIAEELFVARDISRCLEMHVALVQHHCVVLVEACSFYQEVGVLAPVFLLRNLHVVLHGRL